MSELIDRALEQLRAANPVSMKALKAATSEEEMVRMRERSIRLAYELANAGDDRASQAASLWPASRERPSAQSRPRRTAARAAAVLVGLAAATVLILVGIGSIGGGSGGQPTFAAAAIKVAEANPRLLVTEPGWSVTGADEFAPQQGETMFSDGVHELELNWYPARSYKSYYRDRTEVDKTPTMITVLGQRGRTVQYGSSPDYATMFPPQGNVFVEVRGDLGSRHAYLTAVRSLRSVDVNTWLSAMPPTVVRPSERAAAVDEMLNGIPLPSGFDADQLRSGTGTLDRYQLGARVTGEVACTWIKQWADARRTGDSAAAQQAVRAMSTAHAWPILREMASQGGWSPILWRYAREMADGDHGLQSSVQALGCSPFHGNP